MTITVQPASRAPAQQVHGNSMHPKVRAVLDRGLGAEWTPAEVQGLLKLSMRSAQNLFDSPLLRTSAYPAKNECNTRRYTSGLSLLLYLLAHSDEITEADAQPIIKKVLPLLTNQILEGVMGACKALIHKRSGLLVAVKQEEAPAAAKPAPKAAPASTEPLMKQPELFPAHQAD